MFYASLKLAPIQQSVQMLVLLMAAFSGVAHGMAQSPATEQLSASTLPEFVARYERVLTSVGEAFSQLEKQQLPLLDETGRPLGRRSIQDRSKELVELRTDLERLSAKPDNLVLLMTFSSHTEHLADDVYDLSQIAYDNDQEELGKELTDLVGALDQDQDRIEAYALGVASAKQQRLELLEQENRSLQDGARKSVRE